MRRILNTKKNQSGSRALACDRSISPVSRALIVHSFSASPLQDEDSVSPSAFFILPTSPATAIFAIPGASIMPAAPTRKKRLTISPLAAGWFGSVYRGRNWGLGGLLDSKELRFSAGHLARALLSMQSCSHLSVRLKIIPLLPTLQLSVLGTAQISLQL